MKESLKRLFTILRINFGKFVVLNFACIALGSFFYFNGISHNRVTSYPLTSKLVDYRTTKLIVNELNINFTIKQYSKLSQMLSLQESELSSILGLKLIQTQKDNINDPNNYFVLEISEKRDINTLKVINRIIDYINKTGYINFNITQEKIKLNATIQDYDKEIIRLNQFIDNVESGKYDIAKMNTDIGVVYKTLYEITKDRHMAQFELNTLYGVKLVYDSNASQSIKIVTFSEYIFALGLVILIINFILIYILKTSQDS